MDITQSQSSTTDISVGMWLLLLRKLGMKDLTLVCATEGNIRHDT